jgi:hypothetical protein
VSNTSRVRPERREEAVNFAPGKEGQAREDCKPQLHSLL